MLETTVCIIGAGPGGATAALQLAQMGVHTIVVDKAVFPRDKVCGDGLSGKVITCLERIDKDIALRLRQYVHKLDSWGVSFISPGRTGLHVPIKLNYNPAQDAPMGFVCRRIHFDNFLVEELKRRPEIQLLQGVCIEKYELQHDGYLLTDDSGQTMIKAQLLIVANGAHSSFTKDVAGFKMDPEYHAAGIRAYYKNVKGLHADNFIELHFLKNLLPGYFWIFPLQNGDANVGIAVSSATVRKKKMNLKQLLRDVIQNDHILKERFTEATMEGGIEGYGLPLAGRKKRISGQRYMLVGDAAHLIDPFTGEGIGNAIYAGKIAAGHALSALQKNDFSDEHFMAYDAHVLRVLGPEIRVSRRFQKMAKYTWLFNRLVNIGARNKHVRDLITCMFYEADLRKKLSNPMFYVNLLFNRSAKVTENARLRAAAAKN